MDYYLYHDESKKEGYWHGMLLVPKRNRQALLNILKQIRSYNNYDGVVSFKKVRKKNRIYHLNSSYLQCGIASLIQTEKAKKHPIYLGKREKGRKNYETFGCKIGAKFILFRERSDHKSLSNILDYGSKVETTLRMGLKGGIHFLGNAENIIHISKIFVDGHKHYGRNMDRGRVIGRIQSLRDYCSISESDDLIDDRSSNHTKNDSQSYDDCQILQLTDVMVGSFRYQLSKENDKLYSSLTEPAKKLIERYNKGPARMRNSRWSNSICLSECFLENGSWHFNTLQFQDHDNEVQRGLFD